MTTIVYSNGVLASDSQGTMDLSVNVNSIKKIYEPAAGERWSIYGKRILAIGVSGDVGGLAELFEHLKKGIGFETKGKWAAFTDCIAVADDKSFFYVDNRGDKANTMFTHFNEDSSFAIGSGAFLANAYLAIGKKAEDVIKLAIKLDVFSGGAIQVWNFPTEVPADVVAPAITPTQQTLIDQAAKKITDISQEAIKQATAEIIKQTTETAKA